MESVQFEVITPDLARSYLKNAVKNFRPLIQSEVNRYARMMLAGEWDAGASVIRFNENNQMHDGQHTCTSIIKANVSVRVVVVRNMKSADKIDTGVVRSGANVLSNHGITNAKRAASYLRAIHVAPSASSGAGIYAADYDILYENVYGDVVQFCIKAFSSQTKFCKAPVAAAFGRATMCYPNQTEKIFLAAQKCISFTLSEEDETLRSLVRFVTSEQGSAGCAAKELYLKTAHALNLWLKGSRVEKLYTPRVDPFPIPEKYILLLEKFGFHLV